MQLLKISRNRFGVVHKEISDGSEPAMRFYILVAISTLIASFGLISNSTAVVIGAMLVAPLMTPIFGISLGLVRGETKLVGRALQAEIVGVTAAVMMSFLLGLFLGDFNPTPEMLSRTQPNLLDLFVAVLAGFAGAYALVDEKISPALPGVAIATAIVPPLANTGLCLAQGVIDGALGSFLLFFANFLSILIVASTTFVLSGMAMRFGAQAKKMDFVRRFGVPFIAFVLIAAFLAHSMMMIFEEQKITKAVKATLVEELSHLPATTLGFTDHYSDGEKIQVIAEIRTPKLISPRKVSRIQDLLTKEIDKPTELIMHCLLSNNVSALGSVNNVIAPKLDGTFVRASGNELVNQIGTTEQVIREYFSKEPGLNLFRVESLILNQKKLMVAHVMGIRSLSRKEISLLTNRTRKATGDDTIELYFSRAQTTFKNIDGPVRYGWIISDKAAPETREQIRQVREELSAAFERDDTFELVNIQATQLDGKLQFLLEIAGPEIYPRKNLEELEAQLTRKFSTPMAFYSWSRIELVQGPEGRMSLGKLRRYFNNRQKENLPENLPAILEASGQ